MDHIEVGKRGEDIACEFLLRKGHRIVDRNFRERFGEIDIVSEHNGRLCFNEVKTVLAGVSGSEHRPEENVSPEKIKRLGRAIRSYLTKRRVGEETEWDFSVLAVTLDTERKTARVRVINDAIGG